VRSLTGPRQTMPPVPIAQIAFMAKAQCYRKKHRRHCPITCHPDRCSAGSNLQDVTRCFADRTRQIWCGQSAARSQTQITYAANGNLSFQHIRTGTEAAVVISVRLVHGRHCQYKKCSWAKVTLRPLRLHPIAPAATLHRKTESWRFRYGNHR